MAQVTKTVLKTYFNTGDLPTESNFSDLIDSLQSTLVAGTNIKLASQSNGSVKISASVPIDGIISTFSNQSTLESTLQGFSDDGLAGIAVYIPVNGSSYIGTWDFSGLTAPLGTIVIIQETRNAIANPGLTLNGLGIVNRTQRLLSVKISSTSSMAAAIIIRTFRAWEIVGSVGEVQAAN
jgi:hypothetical protein